MQIISGLLLLLYYTRSDSYNSVIFIWLEVNYGWLIKTFHSNNARVVFVVLYLHLFKNLRMASYRLHMT